MRTLLLFICTAFASYCYPQTQIHTPKVRLAIETYAFLKGQSFALERIETQFPTLKDDLVATEKSLKVFRQSQQNIESFLKSELDDSSFKVLQEHLGALLNEQFKNPIQQEKYARNFLEEVRLRSRLISDSLISKAILSFAYHDLPHKEITDGHIITFTTSGHPKAAEANLKMPIPKSWKAEEAEMSETVQQFTSYDGNGNAKILIVIYDLSDQERNMILNKKSIAEMLSPDAKLIRTEAVTIDGNQGMMIETEETLYSNSEKKKIRMLQFMFVEKQKLYCLQGSIGPSQIDENLEPQIRKYEPLFRLVATSASVDN
jgi:hypothetical protein